MSRHNITYIIEEILALDKSVVLKFPDKKSLGNFKSMLSIYLKRYDEKLRSIGGNIFEGKIPAYKLTGLTVEVSLQNEIKAQPLYEILEIKDTASEPN